MNKKIVFISNTGWSITNFRLNLMRFLQEKGFHISAIGNYCPQTAKTLTTYNIDYYPLDIDQHGTNPINDFGYAFKILRLLHFMKPDAICTFSIKPNIYAGLVARILKIKQLANITGLGTLYIHESWRTKVSDFLYKFSIKRAHKIFFQNQDDLEFFQSKNIARNNFDVLPGSGVDLDHFKNTKPFPESLSFLYVGRLILEKGVCELVDAFVKLYTENPDVRLKIIGGYNKHTANTIPESVFKRIQNHPGIQYFGQQKDFRSIIEGSTCVILPSYREGTPRALLEAGAMKRMIITTNTPGCKNLIKNYPHGFMCEIKSSGSLLKAMKAVIGLSYEQRSTLGLNFHEFIKKNYDEKIVFEKYLESLTEF